MINLTDLIYIHKQLLSDEECDQIIEEYESSPSEEVNECCPHAFSGENIYSINNTDSGGDDDTIDIDPAELAVFPDALSSATTPAYSGKHQIMLTSAWLTTSSTTGAVKIQSLVGTQATDLFWFCSSNWSEGKLGVPNIVLPEDAKLRISTSGLSSGALTSLVVGLKKMKGYSRNDAYNSST